MTTLIPALPVFQPTQPVVVDVVTSLSAPNPQETYHVPIIREVHVHASFDHFVMAIAACIVGLGYLVLPNILVMEPLREV